MKKILYIASILVLAVHCSPANAQIKRIPVQKQVSTDQNLPVRNSLMSIVPRKGNIRPVRLVSAFSTGRNTARKVMFGIRNGNGSLSTGNRLTRIPTSHIAPGMSGQNMSLPSNTKVIGGNKITYMLKASNDITSWNEGAEIQPRQVGGAGPDSYDANKGMNCHTITLTFNCQSKSFMNAQPKSQGALLLPGLVYSFEDISNGNFTHHVLDNNRYPISISVDALTQGSPVVDVVNPNLNTIRQAINTLRNGFAGNPGAAGGSDALYQITKTENLAEQSLAVTAGGSYGTVSLQGSFSHSDSKYHLYYTIDAIKEMYTITPLSDSMSLYPPNYPLPANVGYPVMIGPVVYGARVLANMDIAMDASSNAGGLQFNYNGVGSSAFADIKAAVANKNATVSINGMLVGFPQKYPGTFSSTSIDDFLWTVNNFFSGCDYLSAEPIQYTLVDLDGNEMGIQSFTDKTTIQQCTPANEHFVLRSVTGKITTGDDSKNDNSEFWLTIAAGTPNSPIWSGQYYDNRQEFKKEGNDHYIELGNISATRLEDFQKGGFVALKLMAHGHPGGDDWDITTLTLNFNFVSEHGLTKTIPLTLSSFRISDSNHDKNFLFKDDGSDTFKLQ